jgi:hypothetical protein
VIGEDQPFVGFDDRNRRGSAISADTPDDFSIASSIDTISLKQWKDPYALSSERVFTRKLENVKRNEMTETETELANELNSEYSSHQVHSRLTAGATAAAPHKTSPSRASGPPVAAMRSRPANKSHIPLLPRVKPLPKHSLNPWTLSTARNLSSVGQLSADERLDVDSQASSPKSNSSLSSQSDHQQQEISPKFKDLQSVDILQGKTSQVVSPDAHEKGISFAQSREKRHSSKAEDRRYRQDSHMQQSGRRSDHSHSPSGRHSMQSKSRHSQSQWKEAHYKLSPQSPSIRHRRDLNLAEDEVFFIVLSLIHMWSRDFTFIDCYNETVDD